jgi:hypothetical protein
MNSDHFYQKIFLGFRTSTKVKDESEESNSYNASG